MLSRVSAPSPYLGAMMGWSSRSSRRTSIVVPGAHNTGSTPVWRGVSNQGFKHPHPHIENAMRNSGKAPTMVVWVICLVLYVLALIAHFGLVQIDPRIAVWSWIIGLGLLLTACRVRGL